MHTFIATVEGQANATKGDTLILLDDSNSYWWLVRIVKDNTIGYLPAEHIETPSERLARLNKYRNVELVNTVATEPLLSALKLKRKHTFGKRSHGRTVQWSPHKQFFEPPEDYSQFFTDSESSEDEEEVEDEDEITNQDPEIQEEIIHQADAHPEMAASTAPPLSHPPTAPTVKVVKAKAAMDGPRASALFRDPDLETVKLSITPSVAQYEMVDATISKANEQDDNSVGATELSPATAGQRKGSLLGNLFKKRGKRSVSDNLNLARSQSDASEEGIAEIKRSVSATVASNSVPMDVRDTFPAPPEPKKEIPFSETALAAYLDDDSALHDLLLIIKTAFKLSPEEEQRETLLKVQQREAQELGWNKLSSRLNHLSRTLDTALLMYIDPQ